MDQKALGDEGLKLPECPKVTVSRCEKVHPDSHVVERSGGPEGNWETDGRGLRKESG